MKPTALIILDGIGYRTSKKYNAVAQAQTPHLTTWLKQYPHALLKASGSAVGLPHGYIGNSEVGHLTIGSGRVIQQPLALVNDAIDDGSFFTNPTLEHDLNLLHKKGGTLHVMGLLSDAGVHSHVQHLYAFLAAAKRHHIQHIVVHAFLDGRDVAPASAGRYLQQLQTYIAKHPSVTLGSIHGRFYAMDRNKNWTRTRQSFKLFTQPTSPTPTHWRTVLKSFYQQHLSDEFIPPTALHPFAPITANDGIIFFNFRPDRARQLIKKLHDIKPLFILTPVPLDTHNKTDSLFELPAIKNTLIDVLATHRKKMYTIAETEKYAHITYFFNGRREKARSTQERVLIPSIRSKTYAQHPCMSAPQITKAVLQSLKMNRKDFYLVNYANGDMVGHSGNMKATIKAVECIDKQLDIIYQQLVEKMGGTMYITADHGNAETMYDPKTKQVHTAHTKNKVFFIMLRKGLHKTPLKLTQLADIAPFILKNMGLAVPKEMV